MEKYKKEHELLTVFLKNGKNRITPERFLVLDAALEYDGHFAADELYIEMRNNKIKISRATVYNTLEILAECGLIGKRNFGENKTSYEKSDGKTSHDHIVCKNCGTIIEVSSPDTLKLVNKLIEKMDIDFELEGYSLNIYGVCKDKIKCRSNN